MHPLSPPKWQAFINEWSFRHAQIFDANELGRSVAKFVRLVDIMRVAIARAPERRRMYRSEQLELTKSYGNQPFSRILNQLRNREHKEQLIDLIRNRTNPAIWEDEQVSVVGGNYLWRNAPGECDESVCNVSNTSMAELADRRLQDSTLVACLLNIGKSPLTSRRQIEIDAQGTTVQLDSMDDAEALQRWIDGLDHVCPYSADSHDPPTDAQTCLTTHPYRPTNFFNQGRKVYQHNTSGNYACVDNLHYGTKAHIEVFDKRGRHLYEAELDGNSRPRTRDPNKTLPL